MRSEWQVFQLKDICSKIGSGATPRGGNSVYLDDGEYALIRSQNVRNESFEHNGLAFIEKYHADKLSNVTVEDGDVLLNITGDSVARCCQVDPKVLPARVNQHVAIIRPKSEVLDPLYLRYYFVSPLMQNEMLSLAGVGATRNALTKGMIEGFEIPLPPLPEQKAIAHILGTLDDKIELNRRMNVTLEGMAQALFKSWFVDFDPVIDNALAAGNPIPDELAARAEVRRQALADGTANREAAKAFPDSFQQTEPMGWIPEGWAVSTIGEECDTVGGGTPSTKNSDFWEDGEYPWVTPKDFSGLQDKVLLSSSRFLTEEGLGKVSSGLLPIGTVLMSSRAPVGYLAITQIETAINQGFIGMICNKQLPPEYILQWANSRMDEIKQASSGSTFAEISKKGFRPFKVIVPDLNPLEAYSETIAPMYAQITDNVAQSETLSSLRDTLLPKLISGELRLDA
jgi:type I restriction enzyme S subunit